LKDKCGAAIYWAKKDGAVVFRPLPAWDPENPGAWAPCYYEDGGIPWIRRYDVIRGLGDERLSFVINDPENPGSDWPPPDQPGAQCTNPVHLLISGFERAKRENVDKPGWKYRTRTMKKAECDSDARYMAISDSFMVQGILLANGREPIRGSIGLGPQDNMPVIDMDTQVGLDLLNQLRAPGTEPGTWLAWDLLRFDAGGFINLVQRRNPDDPSQALPSAELLWAYQGVSAEIASKNALVTAKVKRWEDAVYVPTVEEQVALICKAKIKPSLIIYTLEAHYKPVIPSWVYDQARAEEPVQTRGFTAPGTPMAGPGLPMTPPAAMGVPAGPGMYAPPMTAPAGPGMVAPGGPASVPVGPGASMPQASGPVMPLPPVAPAASGPAAIAPPGPGMARPPVAPVVTAPTGSSAASATTVPYMATAGGGSSAAPSPVPSGPESAPAMTPDAATQSSAAASTLEGQPAYTSPERVEAAKAALARVRKSGTA
jgi:hypothetical protein